VSGLVIEAEGVSKAYQGTIALDGVDLQLRAGSVLALLGANGAGKTTMVRILTTLLRADAGRVLVGGYDVVREGHAVRELIGLTGQFASVDEHLSPRENLELIARLLLLSRRMACLRTDELLDSFELVPFADRPAATLSGGERRRLDLAASLVGHPAILFLDEPTSGLDLASRIRLWDMVRGLVGEGTAVLLTTQDLDEADEASDDVVVIDHGRVLASGTTDQLKSTSSQRELRITLQNGEDLASADALLRELGMPIVDPASRRITMAVGDDPLKAAEALRVLGQEGIGVLELDVRRPSLADVFLSMTTAESGLPEREGGESSDSESREAVGGDR